MAQSNPSRKPVRRVRYDRIVAVLVILVLLIVILVKCCSSCSSKKEKKPADPAATTTTAVTDPSATEPPANDFSKTVYLSPSNQADNAFAVGDTNEAAECRKIAEKTAAILQQSGLTVIISNDTDSLQQKTAMGDNNLAAYVGIHTNAGTGVGTDCYYNSSSEASKALAQAVYDPVAELTPTADRGLMDGSQSDSDTYQYEIGENKSPCCLIEVEFHDGPRVGQWILDNEDAIAQAIANGICNYLQVTPTSAPAEASTETTSSGNPIEDQLSAGA